jgi:hypothetical protein
MKPLREIGVTLYKFVSAKDKNGSWVITRDAAGVRLTNEERRELVRRVWEAARSVSGNTTNYYTHGDNVEEFLKSEGL